jgi:hypothetical protein
MKSFSREFACELHSQGMDCLIMAQLAHFS